MSETNVERYEVEDPSSDADEPDVILVERDEATRGEIVKFGILAIVLIFTVLIIALLRPYIFNTVIPAVLGEGQPTAPIMDETDSEAIKPDVEEAEESEAVEDSESDAANTEEESGAAESATDSSEEANEPENPEDFPTAVPSQTHTVQVGETLTAIAQRYDVTIEALVSANNITNPDRVTVGTVLVIPEGQ
ncbi:MAG: hypothetical protein CL608_11050 [Anaerolineaceae bacterium]|nr:hypothetical protein [Anaerolineaceae bacterium]